MSATLTLHMLFDLVGVHSPSPSNGDPCRPLPHIMALQVHSRPFSPHKLQYNESLWENPRVCGGVSFDTTLLKILVRHMPATAPQGWFVDMSTNFGAYYPKIGSYLHQNWCAYPRTTPLVPLLACLAPKFLTVQVIKGYLRLNR